MNTLLVDNGAANIESLLKLFAKLSPKLISYEELRARKLSGDELIVLSGSKQMTATWHNSQLAQELKVIHTHKGPIVGVCMGMQLIAHAHRAHMHLMEQRSYGQRDIAVHDKTLWPTEKPAIVFESHNWAVQKVPKELEVLASSENGIEVLHVVGKPIYGVQFHPEASEPGDGKVIFKKLLAKLDIELT